MCAYPTLRSIIRSIAERCPFRKQRRAPKTRFERPRNAQRSARLCVPQRSTDGPQRRRRLRCRSAAVSTSTSGTVRRSAVISERLLSRRFGPLKIRHGVTRASAIPFKCVRLAGPSVGALTDRPLPQLLESPIAPTQEPPNIVATPCTRGLRLGHEITVILAASRPT